MKTAVTFETVALSELDGNTGQIPGLPANPRDWTDKELKNLAKSMRETPLLAEARGAVVVKHDGRYVVLGGNMRRAAAEQLGWDEMVCAVIPEGTPADQLKAIVLKDNSSFGKFDVKALKEDWGEFEFQDMGISLPEAPKGTKEAVDDNYDPSKILNSKKEPKTKRGDIIRLGEHVLICGDSTDLQAIETLMQEGGGAQADLLMTDPPYNVNYGQKGEDYADKDYQCGTDDRKIMNDNMADAAFRSFLTDAFSTAFAVCKDGAPAYIWMGSSEIDACIEAYENAGWLYKQMLIWVKNTFTLGRQDYQWQHENCVYGWKPGAGHYFSESRRNSTIIDGQKPIEQMSLNECRNLLREIFDENGIPTTALRYDKPLRSEEHPTMKPVPMIGALIKNSTQKGGIVLDIFGGSGTTLIACEQLGRRCRTIELDPKYCDVIIDRWEKLTGLKAQRQQA